MIELLPAEKFAEEAEKKPVYHYIYAYYDSALEMFNTPIIERDEPQAMFTGVKNALIKGSIPADKVLDLKFVYLGKVELRTGSFDLLDKPQLLIDCNKFFNKVAKIDA